ncbi:MAG: hypothetical protein IPG10_08885 [Flavobacteriales bacterium]|nr:hypothetical protein [Flavobacteriales bacterium]
MYLDYPLDAAWQAVRASHAAVDSVLAIDLEVDAAGTTISNTSSRTADEGAMRQYSRDYTAAYEDAMGGMVERRMNASILMVGSYWYTAWVNAGQPDLDHFEQREVSDSLKRVIAAEEEQMRMAKDAIGRIIRE